MQGAMEEWQEWGGIRPKAHPSSIKFRSVTGGFYLPLIFFEGELAQLEVSCMEDPETWMEIIQIPIRKYLALLQHCIFPECPPTVPPNAQGNVGHLDFRIPLSPSHRLLKQAPVSLPFPTLCPSAMGFPIMPFSCLMECPRELSSEFSVIHGLCLLLVPSWYPLPCCVALYQETIALL